MAYQIVAIQMTLSNLEGHSLQAFQMWFFRAAVQQLTRYQLT